MISQATHVEQAVSDDTEDIVVQSTRRQFDYQVSRLAIRASRTIAWHELNQGVRSASTWISRNENAPDSVSEFTIEL